MRRIRGRRTRVARRRVVRVCRPRGGHHLRSAAALLRCARQDHEGAGADARAALRDGRIAGEARERESVCHGAWEGMPLRPFEDIFGRV
eukprot:6027898-Pleurochrysis_carterae.AAC.6